jgi:hypothetical protein
MIQPPVRRIGPFLLLPLAACTVFAPRFDPLVSERTNAAYSEVAELLSAVELGKYTTSASFPAAIDVYASIDGQLAAASQRVSALDAPTARSERARDLLQAQIEGCRSRLATLAETHRQAGLVPMSGTTQGVLASCDQAARSADAMR